jgi:ketosteroid isomerase-like protein
VDSRARLVEQLRRAIETRDADRIADLLDPDVVLDLYSSQEPVRGREAARAWYREMFRLRTTFEGRATAEPDPDDPDALILSGRVQWHDAGGGADRPGVWRVTFRDGLIAAIVRADRR